MITIIFPLGWSVWDTLAWLNGRECIQIKVSYVESGHVIAEGTL